LHFITEEALMRRAEYPDYDDHVLLHGRLMEKTRLIARGETSDEEVEQALKFLRDWWLGHINTQDRKYAPAVKKLFA
jgi:hemerythrin-like metal-binding protein